MQLAVNGNTRFTPLATKIGDVNNGTHAVNLGLPLGGSFNDQDKIVFSYLIVNHGGGKSDPVLAACRTALTMPAFMQFDAAQAKEVKAPAGGTLPNCLTSPLRTGEDINTIWNAVKSAFDGVDKNRCDGPVVADKFSMLGSSLGEVQLTSQGNPFSIIYEGTDSHDGCGSNSKYSVQWNLILVTKN